MQSFDTERGARIAPFNKVHGSERGACIAPTAMQTVDTTGDGLIDSVALDTTGDGEVDAVKKLQFRLKPMERVHSARGNIEDRRQALAGAMQRGDAGIDTTGDGLIDAVALDTSGDGMIDTVRPLDFRPAVSNEAMRASI